MQNGASNHSFFEFLTTDCAKSTTTYLHWSCTPDTKTVCDDMKTRWNSLKARLLSNLDEEIKVGMLRFEKENTGVISKKTEKEIIKLVHEKLDLDGIVAFIDEQLVDIIHHRNQLKHFRTAVPMINKCYSDSLYIDFSENLKVPVKWEPQSMHWSHEQITVHSGITKYDGEKFIIHTCQRIKHMIMYLLTKR